MGDFTALGSALYTLIDTASTVGVYQAVAPQGGTPPYVVFNRQAGVDEYTFTSAGVSTDYVVKCVSNRAWPGEAQAVYEGVHGAIQHGSLGVTGFAALRMERRSTIEYRDPEGYWHVGGVYRVEIHES